MVRNEFVLGLSEGVNCDVKFTAWWTLCKGVIRLLLGGGWLTWEFSKVFHYFWKNKNFIHIVENFKNLFNFSFICYTILELGDGFFFFLGGGGFNLPPPPQVRPVELAAGLLLN